MTYEEAKEIVRYNKSLFQADYMRVTVKDLENQALFIAATFPNYSLEEVTKAFAECLKTATHSVKISELYAQLNKSKLMESDMYKRLEMMDE